MNTQGLCVGRGAYGLWLDGWEMEIGIDGSVVILLFCTFLNTLPFSGCV